MRKLFLAIALSIAQQLCYGLPKAIADKVSELRIPGNGISLIVQDVKDTVPIVSLNPDTLRIPASLVKLLTTYAALLEFGSGYRWPTKVYITGGLKFGNLQGNLVVEAFGDPSLVSEDLLDIVNGIKAEGG